MKKFASVLAIVFVIAAALAAHAAVASEDYDKGIALEQEHKFTQARKVYEIGIKKGDPGCMYRMAMFCLEGRGGVKKDNAAGIKLLKKAAKLNQPDANFWLGEFYIEGKFDVKKNPEKGARLIRKAVDLGHVDALCWLGFFTLRGLFGVEQDTEKALALLNEAIEKGVDTAALILGACYEDGATVEQDFKTALDYYKKGADLDNESAKARYCNLKNLPRLVYGCPCPASDKELSDNYKYDVINTNADFKGKTAHASGFVVSSGKDAEGNVYVVLQGPKTVYRNLVCYFDEDRAGDVADTETKEILRVRGEFEGVKKGYVIIRHCRVVFL